MTNIDLTFQRKTKAIERGKKGKEENSEGRKAKVAKEPERCKVYLKIKDHRIHIRSDTRHICLSLSSCIQRSPAAI